MFLSPIISRPNYFIRRNALLFFPPQTSPYLYYTLHWCFTYIGAFNQFRSWVLHPKVSTSTLTHLIPPLYTTQSCRSTSSSHLKRKSIVTLILPPNKRLMLKSAGESSRKCKGRVTSHLFYHFIRPPKIFKLNDLLLSLSSNVQGSQVVVREQPLHKP